MKAVARRASLRRPDDEFYDESEKGDLANVSSLSCGFFFFFLLFKKNLRLNFVVISCHLGWWRKCDALSRLGLDDRIWRIRIYSSFFFYRSIHPLKNTLGSLLFFFTPFFLDKDTTSYSTPAYQKI